MLQCSANLEGSTNEASPSIIYKTEEEEGLSVLWVVEYSIRAELYQSIYTVRSGVELELYFKDGGEGAWDLGDTDYDEVVMYPWSPPNQCAEGWLYVWMDCAYDDGDQFKLVCTAYSQYQDLGSWYHIALGDGSPQTATVYFEISEV